MSRAKLSIVPAAETTEARLRLLFAARDTLSLEGRLIDAEIARLRRRWADERGLITPPRVEALKREIME